MPMWPVHTWLPDAHVQAPTAGSVILAGVLLKMGGYGFIRFSLPMFPEGSREFMPLSSRCRGIAVVYTSLVALVQRDMKKLIAYSSVAHMAFVTFGLFAFNRQGIEGAMMVMLSHGLVSGALFLCVGVIYDRLHTREIDRYGGLAEQHAGLRLAVHALHHGQRRPAGHQQLRRRIPEPGRHLPGVELGGDRRDDRHHPRRGLHALPLLAHLLRRRSATPTPRRCPTCRRANGGCLAPIAAAVLWMGIYPESFIRPMRNDVGRLLDAARAASRPLAISHLTLGKAAAAREHGAEQRIDAPRSPPILPELILSIGGIVLMLVAAFTGRRGSALDQLARRSRSSLAATVALIGAPSHAGPRVRRAVIGRPVRELRQGDHVPGRRGRDHRRARLVRARHRACAPNMRC